MKTHMNDTQLETIEQIEAFLLGSQTVDFIIEDKEFWEEFWGHNI